MENIGILLHECMEGLMMEFVIYGHVFSWWQVYLFSIIGTLVVTIIAWIIYSD